MNSPPGDPRRRGLSCFLTRDKSLQARSAARQGNTSLPSLFYGNNGTKFPKRLNGRFVADDLRRSVLAGLKPFTAGKRNATTSKTWTSQQYSLTVASENFAALRTRPQSGPSHLTVKLFGGFCSSVFFNAAALAGFRASARNFRWSIV